MSKATCGLKDNPVNYVLQNQMQFFSKEENCVRLLKCVVFFNDFDF